MAPVAHGSSTLYPPPILHPAALPSLLACREYCWEARWIIFWFSLFFFLSSQASRQVCLGMSGWLGTQPKRILGAPCCCWLAPAGAAPAHLLTCCHPIPPSPILQLADYFIRWWTRDHYQKYSPDCEGLCGGQFYVQYYGILGLVSVCSTCSGGQPSFPVLPCLHAGTSTASLLAFIWRWVPSGPFSHLPHPWRGNPPPPPPPAPRRELPH